MKKMNIITKIKLKVIQRISTKQISVSIWNIIIEMGNS